MIQFFVIPRGNSIPSAGSNVAYLYVDHWNDYSFITMFHVTLFDESAVKHELGSVKIGFRGQTEKTPTYSTLGEGFATLSPEYFSVGVDVDYYLTLFRDCSSTFRMEYLTALRDVAHDQQTLQLALNESVFQTSLLRSLNINTVTDQFRRVLLGEVPLTDYAFRFTQEAEGIATYQLDFNVKANSTPTTNIHAIIGRNGVGNARGFWTRSRKVRVQRNAIGRSRTSSDL